MTTSTEIRIKLAAQILAGFAANPAVFAPSGQRGWQLMNRTEEDLVAYCYQLADKLIKQQQNEQVQLWIRPS